MKKLIFALALLSACSKSEPPSVAEVCDKPETRWVSSIGGCDQYGYCGVILQANDSSFIHAVMRYPVKDAVALDYVHCYVPYKQPAWYSFLK